MNSVGQNQSSHNINFKNFKVVGSEANYQERLSLEAWHSTLDPNTGNDHIVLPEVWKPWREHELHGHARKLCARFL